MNIAAGRLDRLITVLVRTVTPSPLTGEHVETWSDLWVDLPAEHLDRAAGERFAARQAIAEIDTIFTVRWHPALDVIRPDTHRVRFEGREYKVHGTMQDGRRGIVQINCVARAEAGV